jgi:DNA-binding NarL/FixJ family response regulator
MTRINVLIADDHTVFRQGMRKMLESEEDMAVVGEAATGREALQQARRLLPDVILMDIKMPDMDGIEATRVLHPELPRIGVIFCTMFPDEGLIRAGLQAGGRGYLLKDGDAETMLHAIRAVAQGEVSFSPAIAAKAMRYFAN